MKEIILLGASGSIGQQTIDVVKQHADQFKIVALSVGKRISVLKEILKEIKVDEVCVQNQKDALKLAKEYPNIHFSYGDNGLLHLVSLPKGDIVVNALLGFSGLMPTLKAIEHKKNIALANKETLVAGGQFVKEALKKYQVTLYPIDSEHSAIFQCLQGNSRSSVKRLIITASGGSFRDKTREELKDVTVKEALSHPNWSMGKKITIDSATMMNKGLEVLEAHWLFDLPFSKIDTIMHKESVIHSMVEFEDTAIMAQLGTPDMRLPIQYALTYPERLPLNGEYLDWSKFRELHFEPLSMERFPMLRLAYEVGEKGGNLPAIMNGANEAAVQLFLDEKIKFLEIEELVEKAVHNLEYQAHPTLEEVIDADQKARIYVNQLVEGESN
ncbi:MAG: 1-deoxy-D-xylulose-5-phosphate reductoisomerase [Erysipelotrichaceae bacterium]|nr:1-deoxy-D-xylulose-5-phosphate reductoisomerase [Erysipelotrichaceae bacterium]